MGAACRPSAPGPRLSAAAESSGARHAVRHALPGGGPSAHPVRRVTALGDARGRTHPQASRPARLPPALARPDPAGRRAARPLRPVAADAPARTRPRLPRAAAHRSRRVLRRGDRRRTGRGSRVRPPGHGVVAGLHPRRGRVARGPGAALRSRPRGPRARRPSGGGVARPGRARVAPAAHTAGGRRGLPLAPARRHRHRGPVRRSAPPAAVGRRHADAGAELGPCAPSRRPGTDAAAQRLLLAGRRDRLRTALAADRRLPGTRDRGPVDGARSRAHRTRWPGCSVPSERPCSSPWTSPPGRVPSPTGCVSRPRPCPRICRCCGTRAC